MKIIGHEKTSFIDYPDKICTVYFVAGCNFRCSYCHNSHVVNDKGQTITEEEIFSFLHKRKKYIDGVCITGGEPTLYETLYDFIYKVKSLGFLVKLDTNGTNPKMLQRFIDEKLLDYIAMDIKAPFNKYKEVVKAEVDLEAIKSSINMIKNSGTDYEFRTTVCKELLSKEDILQMIQYLKGSRRYTLQNFKDGETVLAGPNKFHPYEIETLEEIREKVQSLFDIFKIRK